MVADKHEGKIEVKKRKRVVDEGIADAAAATEASYMEEDSAVMSSPERKEKKKKRKKEQEGGNNKKTTVMSHEVNYEEIAAADAVSETKEKKKKKKKERQKETEEGLVEGDGDDDNGSEAPAERKEQEEVEQEEQQKQQVEVPSPPLTSGLDMVRRLLSGHTRKTELSRQEPGEGEGADGQEKHKPKVVVEEDDPATLRTASDMAREWGLDLRLLPQLDRHGVRNFFAVQCRVLPYLLSTNQADLVRDVVVSAPTGSGKTLVYALALLQGLRHRRIVRLRGLIVVPNRDLAVQVLSELQKYAGAVGLNVALAIGHTDFAKEQAEIVGHRHEAEGGVVGGVSLVDILVATPGRLMDHLERTPGFTLQHLKYLVIDEVDRLVTQSYQDWVHKVYEAAYGQVPGQITLTPDDQPCHLIRPATVRVCPESKLDKPVLPVLQPVPLRKLLFSATITSNPQKLALLGLRNPRRFSIKSIVTADMHGGGVGVGGPAGGGKFSTPDSLKEYSVSCSTEKKPLVLLHLLALPALTRGLVLIFTSSVDSTHRLCRLLQMCCPSSSGSKTRPVVEEFSSALTQPQRADLIKRCLDGRVNVLVSSDGMARGIDVANVETVINYDVPSHPKTYVHRVGRTARAGRQGVSYSLIKRGQEQQFQRMRSTVDNKKVETFSIQQLQQQAREEGDAAGRRVVVMEDYQRALRRLKEVLDLEKQRRLKLLEPLGGDLAGDDGDDEEEGEEGEKERKEQEEDSEAGEDEEDLIEGPGAADNEPLSQQPMKRQHQGNRRNSMPSRQHGHHHSKSFDKQRRKSK